MHRSVALENYISNAMCLFKNQGSALLGAEKVLWRPNYISLIYMLLMSGYIANLRELKNINS